MVRLVAGRLLETGRVGLLPAMFDPPTAAHVALAETAEETFALDQVVYVLPESPPHKRVERPGPERRLAWLAELAASRSSRAAAACPGGLVAEIVNAFRQAVGAKAELFVIAGRDAAERYANWDYGDGEGFSSQLRHYTLLVASRDGAYVFPPEHAGRILPFEIDSRMESLSSSALRLALRAGTAWRHMVPPEIAESVQAAYRSDAP